MRTTTRRTAAALAVPLLALALVVTTMSSASAQSATRSTRAKAASPADDPQLPFNYFIDATTTLAKLNQTVTVPRGSFKGSIDLTTFQLTGEIKLPPATATVAEAGLPLATATFKISEVGPVTGSVDFSTLIATATSVFNIKLVSLTPAGLPMVNLVGDKCKTSKPVSVTMQGPLTPPLVFSGTYTVPPLKNCGALTTVLNQLVPGPGNQFSATATPKH